MQKLKVSVVTVVYNAEKHVERCIRSVLSQSYQEIEYIIVDGGSSDLTTTIISKYREQISQFISEKDHGIYDALNKGIRLATGDIVGILNADDLLADESVIAGVADVFLTQNADMVYGDLDFIDSSGKVIRKWRSGDYLPGKLNRGWMPPHPTFYCKRELFGREGYYQLGYGSAGDYELMLRFLRKGYCAAYFRKVMIKMQVGGVSNRSLGNRLTALRNDLKAMKSNGLPFPLLTILLKPLRKIDQFF